MSETTRTYVFPDNGDSRSSIDPALLVALSQNGGGFGNGAMWMWPMFMYMMFPWLFGGMGAGFGGFGGFGGGALGAGATALGTGYLANQLNQNSNVDTLLQAMNGRADCISQLATILNTNVGNVQNGINALQAAVQQVSNLTGMTGQQIINSIQNGNAALSQQLCQCCCDNRLAICQLGNELGRQADNHFSSLQYQIGQNHGEDRLDVCQQTNQLGSQADRNKQEIKDMIAAQNAMLEQRFCEIKEREMQDKINTQSDIITQLRGQLDNDRQTMQFNERFRILDDKIDGIAAKQPNTVPVQYPNLVAVNNTPAGCGCNRGCGGCGQWGGYPQTSFFN